MVDPERVRGPAERPQAPERLPAAPTSARRMIACWAPCPNP